MVKVAVSGAAGKMGKTLCQAILAEKDLELVSAADPSAENKTIGNITGENCDIVIYKDVDRALEAGRPDVLVDFTHPDAVMNNIKSALGKNTHIVVGTTGIGDDKINTIKELLNNSTANVFIAPNFAIGAVLMMYLAQIASRYLHNYEIIELHHDQKADAPSGTSIATAAKLQGEGSTGCLEESLKGARGAEKAQTRIHSIRLPGLVAHQEVIFGAQGQTLTIRHDSIDRTCFMPGIIMAIKRVSSLDRLTIGLEKLLGLDIV